MKAFLKAPRLTPRKNTKKKKETRGENLENSAVLQSWPRNLKAMTQQGPCLVYISPLNC
jgi:hypothetical protein